MADFKLFRKDNNLSQEKAAAYFGCAQSFISQIEQGKRKIPSDFITKAKADITMNTYNLMADESYIEDNSYESVPASFVKMIFEERKMHDQKELKLIIQNQELINIIKEELSNIKKANLSKKEE